MLGHELGGVDESRVRTKSAYEAIVGTHQSSREGRNKWRRTGSFETCRGPNNRVTLEVQVGPSKHRDDKRGRLLGTKLGALGPLSVLL
jgi:hypothetical protein